MTSQNVDIVRRFYETQRPGFALVVAGRIDEALALPSWALLADDCVLDEVREFPDAARYRGRDGLMQWTRQLAELFDEFENETRSFEDHGGRVLVDVHQRFYPRHGPPVEHDLIHVFTIRRGLITHITGYRTREEALQAVSDTT